MAHFYTVWNLRNSVREELAARVDARDEMKEVEQQAAVDIERVHRGCMVRSWKTGMVAASIQVQRVFRGFMGRNKSAAALAETKRAARMGFFHYQATQVQKLFRGYYSRRYYHDFFARKNYIQEVVIKSEKLKVELAAHRQALLQRDARAREESARSEFTRVTENLHHLLSTKCQPGIYNSPYLQGDVPTAFNIPVEDHLRHGVKSYLRRSGKIGATRGSTAGSSRSRGSMADGRTTFASRPRSRISVQAEGVYGEDQEARRLENKYSRLKRLSPKPFSAGTKSQMPPSGPGISQGTPYEELWKVARSSRDPALEDKSKRVSDKPFVSAMKRGGAAFDDHADSKWAEQFQQQAERNRTGMPLGSTKLVH